MGTSYSGTIQSNWTNSVGVTTTQLISGARPAISVIPSNPTGTSSATQVMMGLGASASITPAINSQVMIAISGDVFNASAIADGAAFSIRYGTGAAPANGDAQTGTACGALAVKYVAATTAEKAPFSITCIATGLSAGTAYWIDLSLANITGGTAAVNDVTIAAHEL